MDYFTTLRFFTVGGIVLQVVFGAYILRQDWLFSSGDGSVLGLLFALLGVTVGWVLMLIGVIGLGVYMGNRASAGNKR